MNKRESYLDFWLGFAFGSLSVAAFLAGTWANGVLLEFIP
jgi:hypothetical protein